MPRIDWSSLGPGVPAPVGISLSDLAAEHDTDAERETFVPSRLSASALKAAFVAVPTGGTDGQSLVKSGSTIAWGAGALGASVTRDSSGAATITLGG